MSTRFSILMFATLALSACVSEAAPDSTPSTGKAAKADPGKSEVGKANPAKSDPGKTDPASKPAAKTPTSKPVAKPAAKPEAKPVAKPDATPPLPAAKPPQAPEKFKVQFTTTCGEFTVEATRAWAPNGADRFHEMVDKGFFKDIAFFRVINGFMVQFGIYGDPKIAAKWRPARIKDDPVTQSNARGMMTFATSGPNSRTTQMFINFRNNANLDGMGFSPFAKVIKGMETVDKIYKVGEGAPRGPGPGQGRIQNEGNTYLKKAYPQLDYIKSAKFVE